MVIPDDKGKIKKLKIPAVIIHSATILIAMMSILVAILVFDYWKIFQEVYQNKHVTQENKLLKEQITLFKTKIDSLSIELNRLHIFEKKLRVITGLETIPTSTEEINKDQTYIIDEKTHRDSLEFIKTEDYYKKMITKQMLASIDQTTNATIKKYFDQSLALASDFSSLDYNYSFVKKGISQVEEDLFELDEHLLEKESLLQSTPTILPANGWITSYFGTRLSPYAGKVKMHEGLDIGAPIGTNIIAPADGVVTFSGNKTGFGNFIKINHGYGVETSYAHASKLVVRTGKKVRRGELIAKVGNTGYSTGPHLHYEIHVNGIAVDPYYFVLQ